MSKDRINELNKKLNEQQLNEFNFQSPDITGQALGDAFVKGDPRKVERMFRNMFRKADLAGKSKELMKLIHKAASEAGKW